MAAAAFVADSRLGREVPTKNGFALCFYAFSLSMFLVLAAGTISEPTSPRIFGIHIALVFGIGAALLWWRLRSLQQAFHVLHAPLVWTTVVLLGSTAALFLFCSMLVDESSPVLAGSPAKAVAAKNNAAASPATLKVVDSTMVHGHEIRKGMTSDEAFEILKKGEEPFPADVRSDPAIPDSMIMIHRYIIGPQQLSVEFRRGSQAGPYVISKIVQSDPGNQNPTKGFDLAVDNVGADFKGDDIVAITNALQTAQKKDEYETSAEYKTRLATFKTKLLTPTTTPDGYLVFVQQDLHDGDLNPYQGAQVRSRYDADKQILSLTPELGYGLGVEGPLVGKDGQGLHLQHQFSEPTTSKLPMAPERAKGFEYGLNLLFVCKLAEPWIDDGFARFAGTGTSGKYVPLLKLRSVQVWVYSELTGEVLHKEALRPLRVSSHTSALAKGA